MALARYNVLSLDTRIVNDWGAQVGEWLFSGDLFGAQASDERRYVDHLLDGRRPTPAAERLITALLTVRRRIPTFLDECLQSVLDHHPRIVGFSSMFQQHTPSLALAKRIKGRSPQTFVVFGGANCEGPMGKEIIRQFPFVDAVVSGEGDRVFPKLAQRVSRGERASGVQGVYTQGEAPAHNTRRPYRRAPLVNDMDALPYPDFDDYFEQLRTTPVRLPDGPGVPMETSRGCWWAEKTRCAFCGLCGAGITYRAKSSRRALDELTELSRRYPSNRIVMTDNVLSRDYFDHFVPDLSAKGLRVRVSYEVRPSLSKGQVRALREAGITAIQPGIESLSDPVLRLMRKGVGALQNIQLLKWAKELGVRTIWNLLWGFPSEPPGEYARMADLIPLLVHLGPPDGSGPMHLDRFSLYFERAEEYGLVDVEPWPSYRYVYPLNPEVVANLAYYFSYSYRAPQDVARYTGPLTDAVACWERAHQTSDVFSMDTGRDLLIWDERPMASEQLTTLRGLQKDLYVACDSAQSLLQLQRTARERNGTEYSKREIEELLRPILDRGLMIREGSRYLSLAIPVGEYQPRPQAWARFQKHLQAMAEMACQQALMARITMEELPSDQTVGTEEIRHALHMASNHST